MAAGVGVNLGPVQADTAEPTEPVLPGDLQHLHEGRFKFLAEAAPEGRQGVVVRVQVAGNEPKRQRIVGGPLDLAAGEAPGGVAVDQQRQQHGRVIGRAPGPGIRLHQRTQIQAFHHLDHVACQVAL